ncbi:M24 family metallopeptidase [Devosia sp. YIM 151766]|uniref:M24 family metallopeptidase n=1 Tax=Devosia sp. YIM 151766 TaxID=3017325 RepID=UPI00255CEBF6|nr:M24 family metallopeptidase [Devosia sp. YIM 151766]WIY53873.1 M24 family metallopeptidase [Devosia sp. YIM 151766]
MNSPISNHEKSERLSRLRGLLEQKTLDGAVLFASPRILGPATQTAGVVQYFSGWSVMGTPTVLVVPLAGRPIIVVPGKNEDRLMRHRCGGQFDIVQLAGRSWTEAIDAACADLSISGSLGLAGAREMTLGNFGAWAQPNDRLVPLDADLAAMRMRKSPAELALHEAAVGISEAMVEAAIDAVRRRVSPAQIMAEVEFEGRRQGADISRLWLSTGPNPPVTYFEMFELPETLDMGDRIQLGTVVTCEGYYAQTLRTISLGAPSDALVEANEALQHMQDVAVGAFRVGAALHDVVDTLENAIDAFCPFTRENDPFRFQSCHGLGLDYVDPGMAPALSPLRNGDTNPQLVLENMVMEIHPNFNLPGLGHVCLGDVAVATPTGGKWLGKLPRTILEIA